jgi:hypothetical protein
MRELLARKVGVQSTGRSVGIISASGINDLLQRLDLIEKKDKVVGIVSSAAIALVLLFALLFWIAKAGLVMGIDEPEWKTIGLISPGADYGTSHDGDGEINNFQDPSPTADGQDRPPSPIASAAAAAPASSPTPTTNPAPAGTITGNEPSPISANSGNSNNSKPTKTDNATGSSNNNAAPTGALTGGGSNDGNTGKTGNTGSPTATVLNPDGLYNFGPGVGGAGGRSALKTELKGYNVQLEEKIKFEITIDPDGDVIFVKAPFALHQELVEIGKENIKRWKFSETDPNAGNLKTTVTISFRLK